jgi:HEAT repeat protein
MLDTLDQIDWTQLQHAYGEASDVPGLLRALAQGSQEECRETIYELFGNIWHQGTVYSATPVAVPFLIELLEGAACRGREGILNLLKAIATGSSYLDVHGGFDWYRQERKTPEFAARRERELQHVRDAHEAVLRGVRTYVRLLDDDDPLVRQRAAFTLAECIEARADAAGVLWTRFEQEDDVTTQCCLVLALAELTQHPAESSRRPPPTRLFQSLLEHDDRAVLTRLVAGLALLRGGSEQFRDETLVLARHVMDTCANEFESIPWEHGGSVFRVIDDHLGAWPRSRLAWELEGLRHSDRQVRQDAIFAAESLCCEYRWAPAELAPRLRELADDPNEQVRTSAVRVLGAIGVAGERLLDELCRHSSDVVRRAAAEARQRAADRRTGSSLAALEPRSLWRLLRPVPGLLRGIARARSSSKSWEAQRDLQSAVIELGRKGASAAAAVPLLKELADHESPWVRVHALRALWRITGDPGLVVAPLLAEIDSGRVMFLVLDCLQQMGPQASAALPRLRAMIDSERRVVRIGTTLEICGDDEACLEACVAAVKATFDGWLTSPSA